MGRDSISLPGVQVLARLLGGEVNGGQILAPGPGHSATDRSLSVMLDSSAPDGFLTHSFANDDPIACRDHVRAKAGLEPFKPNGGNGHRRFISPTAIDAAVMRIILGEAGEADDKPTISQSKQKGDPVATYPYIDAAGTLLYQVLRYEPKDFRQCRPDGNDGWIWKLDERRVLYRLPELLKYPDATIFICEGEKDADRVASLNHCATTVAAGKWTSECVKALAGRDCVILQDNDEPGAKKALAAAQALHGTAKTIRIVSLPDLPDKGDVSDWLDADPRRAETLAEICFKVPEWTPTAGICSSSSPWKYHTGKAPTPARWCIKGILPETGAAIMSGQWGVFKTTVALEISVCVMAGLPFADRYRIKRRGAVLYIALEGEHMLSARLSAIAEHRGVTGPLPFAWRGDCPALTSKNAANEIVALANEAAAELKRKFDLPIALIWVDTMITAAGYEDGGDNELSQGIASSWPDR
jgi:AAA domain